MCRRAARAGRNGIHASRGMVAMDKKMPAALAIAMWAVIPAWTPRG
jgi:hypothetical protein